MEEHVMNESLPIATLIALIEEKKAQDVRLISLKDRSTFVDTMIVATATSTRHVFSLYQYVETFFKEQGITVHVEGIQQSEWILIYAEGVMVHLMLPEVRDFYKIEELWQESPSKAIHHKVLD